MTLKERTFTVELTADEVHAIVDALNAHCRAIGEEIKALGTTDLKDRDKLLSRYVPAKDLRNSLGSLVGTAFYGSDY